MHATPTLLLILDGWGLAPDGPGNAISLAKTPNYDDLRTRYPATSLRCTGNAVGLPEGFMGNSEVGHMNIGAGRVIYQDMTRIDMAIEDGSLKQNETLLQLFEKTRERGGRMHFMGLVSDGGVHSHIRHLHALLDMAQEYGVESVVHAFLDGRDTPPTSGKGYVQDLHQRLQEKGQGRIATVVGRYYAMDRDKRWDRNALAYAALTAGQGEQVQDPVSAVQQAYDAGENDEFVTPRVIVDDDGQPVGPLQDGDGLFFFNFRADRARQISRALFEENFEHFQRAQVPDLAGFATMTRYEKDFPLPVAFPPQDYNATMGEVVSGLGLRQLRIAETEKYAHVTYFFNCGREEPFPGEERQLVPSPREVATYDQKPQMSAPEVTDRLVSLWQEKDFAFVVCNLANGDMVGHSGIIDAAVQACEVVDGCIGRLVDVVLGSGGRVLLTADHGNADEMLDENGEVQTAHSKNPVPLILVDPAFEGREDKLLRPEGKLGDIVPTVLQLWNAQQPAAMTGQGLLVEER